MGTKIALILTLLCASVALAQSCDWTGTWNTIANGDSNVLVLEQSGNSVAGTYTGGGHIQGTVTYNELKGTYTRWDGKTGGAIDFTMSDDCNSFTGQWQDGNHWYPWVGRR